MLYHFLSGIVMAQINGSAYPSRPENISLEQLIDIARRNHIEYFVYDAILKEENLTDEFISYFNSSIKINSLKSFVQITELMRIEQAFEKEGINNMPLKGAILKFLYPKAELRAMSDIDILVARDKIAKADKVLQELGYTLKSSVKHHDIYYKAPYMIVEMHKDLYDKTVDLNQFKYFLGFDKAVLKTGKHFTYEMTPENFYIYMISHAAKHFYAMGCGIRNLIDIFVFLREYDGVINREYVDEELKKCHTFDFEREMRQLAFDWLEGRDLDEFESTLFDYMLDAGIYGKDENGIWNKFCNTKKDEISKLELRMWYFFPPMYYMCEYFPWIENRPYLLPVAWFLRGVHAVIRKSGKKKRKMLNCIHNDQIVAYKTIYKRVKLDFSRN